MPLSMWPAEESFDLNVIHDRTAATFMCRSYGSDSFFKCKLYGIICRGNVGF